MQVQNMNISFIIAAVLFYKFHIKSEMESLFINKLLLSIFKEFENLSVEKMTLSTALGFEPRSFDCRSTALINLLLSIFIIN